jgi:hypothetical protein
VSGGVSWPLGPTGKMFLAKGKKIGHPALHHLGHSRIRPPDLFNSQLNMQLGILNIFWVTPWVRNWPIKWPRSTLVKRRHTSKHNIWTPTGSGPRSTWNMPRHGYIYCASVWSLHTVVESFLSGRTGIRVFRLSKCCSHLSVPSGKLPKTSGLFTS